ncbi:MAG TPA: tetratricopeptide repeat protein, partial [Vicinamibacteria bacterium]|nr:tetratricopeptide repeat protein [Vicinamibacteria bacterium]
AAAVVAAAALAGAGRWWQLHLAPSPPVTRPVVAVLPLDSVGPSPDDHLGLGMADTLVAYLAGFPSLTVVSHTAVPTGEAPGRVRRLAQELGADYVVSGSIQRMDRRMRVTATLVRPDESVAWGGDYEGHVDEIFSLQRRLAEGVSTALAVSLTPARRARLAQSSTRDAGAFEAYSEARALIERPDVPGNVGRAIDGFQRAIARDRRFALAHAALGRAHWQHYTETLAPESARMAIDAVTEALRLDPAQPATRLALAVIYAGTGRSEAAVEELRRLLELQPSSDEAHRQLGDIFAAGSRWEEAIAEHKRAVDLRPRYADNLSHLGLALMGSGRHGEAADVYRRLAELQPDNPRAYQRLGTAYHTMGDDERALANYRRALALGPDSKAYTNVGSIHYARGELDQASAAFREAARLEPGNPLAQRNLGDAYARAGRREDAQEAYRAAVRLSEAMLRVNPKDARALGRLAVYEAKLGRRAAADRHAADAVALSPADGDVIYRKAVVEALAGRPDAALGALREALARGFSASQAKIDDDLASLRGRAEFAAVLAAPR